MTAMVLCLHWGEASCTTVYQGNKGNALPQLMHLSPALPTQTQRHIKTFSTSQHMHSLGIMRNADCTTNDSILHPSKWHLNDFSHSECSGKCRDGQKTLNWPSTRFQLIKKHLGTFLKKKKINAFVFLCYILIFLIFFLSDSQLK